MKFKGKVFFTLFPKGYWIVMAVGIFFNFLPEISELGDVLINLATFLLAHKGAVIIHEVGHLLAAKAVGGVPRRMVLGKGHELYRTKIFNIRPVIHSSFLGGYAYASFDQPKFLKLRYGFFTLGGILLNVIFALVFYAFFDLNLHNSKGEVSVAVPFMIFLANGLMVLNFIPFYTRLLGKKVPTDGLALLKLPFTKTKEVKERLDVNQLFDGYEYIEKKEYQSAWRIFRDHLNKYPDSKILSLNLSFILLKTGHPDKSVQECLRLIEHMNEREIKPFAALIYNQLAWIYLVLNSVEQADHFSALAVKLAPNEPHIRSTRGSLLVEKGMATEGMILLFHNMDLQFVNNETLSGAIYLMLAYYLKGEKMESDKYMEFIKRNEQKLEADEIILFQRNLLRMKSEMQKLH